VELRTTDYPESGLDNVQLFNVPVRVCKNGHEEVEIPSVTALHELLAGMIIRKPAMLNGREIRFLRKRAGLQAKDFAQRIGITPEHMSKIENGRAKLHRTYDLLIRLAIATLLAARDGKPLPQDLVPLIDRLEDAWDELGQHRARHADPSTRQAEWEAVS
jgi:transcriptional regulator with XRE-family HTH domain